MAFCGDQWRGREEAHSRLTGNHRVAGETRVQAGVGHFQQRMGAELGAVGQRFPGGPREIESVLGLEPLTSGVDEADNRHRSGAHVRGKRGQVVKSLFWRRVENCERIQRDEAIELSACLAGGLLSTPRHGAPTASSAFAFVS